jgi:hypothetical protein
MADILTNRTKPIAPAVASVDPEGPSSILSSAEKIARIFKVIYGLETDGRQELKSWEERLEDPLTLSTKEMIRAVLRSELFVARATGLPELPEETGTAAFIAEPSGVWPTPVKKLFEAMYVEAFNTWPEADEVDRAGNCQAPWTDLVHGLAMHPDFGKGRRVSLQELTETGLKCGKSAERPAATEPTFDGPLCADDWVDLDLVGKSPLPTGDLLLV